MSEETQEEFIYLTHTAHRHIRECLMDGFHIRVAVKGGGCSGLSYDLAFTPTEKGDTVIEHEGFKVFMDAKSLIYLKGMMLDYKGGLDGKGFVFVNPNATSTCGCGESFSIT